MSGWKGGKPAKEEMRGGGGGHFLHGAYLKKSSLEGGGFDFC